MKQNIRIAQVTDMHVTCSREGLVKNINTYERFRRVTDEVAKRSYDYVIFSGDCSEDGSLQSYQLIAEVCRSIQTEMQFLLGNHDSCMLFKGLSELAWQKSSLLQFLTWQMLILETKVEGEKLGRLSDLQLETLARFVEGKGTRNKAIVLHHNPISVGCGQLDAYMLENHRQFIEIISGNSNVRLVMFGHVHNDCSIRQGHIQFECAPATSYQFIDGDSKRLDSLHYGYKEYIFTEHEAQSNVVWCYDA